MYFVTEFSASLLQSSVSHDSSEIILKWFGAQEYILNYYLADILILKTDVQLNFLWKFW